MVPSAVELALRTNFKVIAEQDQKTGQIKINLPPGICFVVSKKGSQILNDQNCLLAQLGQGLPPFSPVEPKEKWVYQPGSTVENQSQYLIDRQTDQVTHLLLIKENTSEERYFEITNNLFEDIIIPSVMQGEALQG